MSRVVSATERLPLKGCSNASRALPCAVYYQEQETAQQCRTKQGMRCLGGNLHLEMLERLSKLTAPKQQAGRLRPAEAQQCTSPFPAPGTHPLSANQKPGHVHVASTPADTSHSTGPSGRRVTVASPNVTCRQRETVTAACPCCRTAGCQSSMQSKPWKPRTPKPGTRAGNVCLNLTPITRTCWAVAWPGSPAAGAEPCLRARPPVQTAV